MHLHLDCPTGISGDMFLAAMADLGLDLTQLEKILNRAGLRISIRTEQKVRNGLTGTALGITLDKDQTFRDLHTILELIQSTELSLEAKKRSSHAFKRLAAVEAAVHGVDISRVHFHEVGAADTILDVLGCFWSLEQMGISTLSCSSLPWFQGFVDCAHGRLPLPAPATVALLKGKPVYPTGYDQEIITPTGALLLDQAVTQFADGPRGCLEKTGTGWGAMDLGSVPNGLRVFLTRSPAESREEVWVLESNLDHLSGEELGSLLTALQDNGALDLIYLPGVMKKSRPGGLLQVLCLPQDLGRVRETFFQHSLTLGIRQRSTERVVLARKQRTLQTRFGDLEGKELRFKDQHLSKPEFEALRELAAKTGRSVIELRYLLSGSKPASSD